MTEQEHAAQSVLEAAEHIEEGAEAMHGWERDVMSAAVRRLAELGEALADGDEARARAAML